MSPGDRILAAICTLLLLAGTATACNTTINPAPPEPTTTTTSLPADIYEA